jgi:hypothetical protein
MPASALFAECDNKVLRHIRKIPGSILTTFYLVLFLFPVQFAQRSRAACSRYLFYFSGVSPRDIPTYVLFTEKEPHLLFINLCTCFLDCLTCELLTTLSRVAGKKTACGVKLLMNPINSLVNLPQNSSNNLSSVVLVNRHSLVFTCGRFKLNAR